MAFLGKNPPGGVAEKLPSYVKSLAETFPTVTTWGVVGVSALKCLFFRASDLSVLSALSGFGQGCIGG